MVLTQEVRSQYLLGAVRLMPDVHQDPEAMVEAAAEVDSIFNHGLDWRQERVKAELRLREQAQVTIFSCQNECLSRSRRQSAGPRLSEEFLRKGMDTLCVRVT